MFQYDKFTNHCSLEQCEPDMHVQALLYAASLCTVVLLLPSQLDLSPLTDGTLLGIEHPSVHTICQASQNTTTLNVILSIFLSS